MKKRLLSLVLVFSFIFGTLPVNVLAGAMQTGKSEQKIETITGNGKANVKYRDETDHDLTTLSPSVKIDKEKYPVIAEGQAGKEISKEHLDIEKAPKFIGYKIKSVKTYPVPAKNETANYTTDGKYTVKFIYEKIDDIIEPLKPSDDFPEGYVAVKFFADDSENDRGVFAGNKREVVYAVNPINTEIDMVAKTLKGRKADGKTDIKKDFPTYSVKKASEAIWKTNDKAPWKMNHENAIGPDKKIDVNKLGEHQDLTFTAQYEALTIAEIIKKGNLVPATLKVWVGDTTIPWKKGVKVADTVTDEKLKEKIEGYLNDAETSYKDITTPARTSKGEAVGKPITGTIRVTFSDNSFIDVANQELYVIPHITFSTNDKAPDNAIEVTFKLGEGVKAGDKTGKETAVEYGMYKVKPNTKLDDYKLGTGKTIFGSINAVVTDNKKYTGVVWEGQTANKPEDHVVTDSNKVFTAKATKIFTVKHEFVSGTKGKVLPTTGMPNAPEVVTGKIGSTVNAPTTTYKDVKVAEGTWKFKGWSPATLKVSATDKDNKFVGKWEFTPDKKTVNLTFEFYKKKDSGNTLQPDNALGDFKKPKLENLTGKEVGAEITLPKYQGQTVNTGDLQGTWKFDGWYRGDKKLTNAKVSAIDAENKLVGKWILTETKTAKVTREFVIDPTIMGDGKDVPTGHKLPNAVKVDQKVNDTTNYIGSTQTPGKDKFTAVPETINGKQGTWTFKEWTPKELTVNKEEAKNVFTGTWTWTEKDKIEVKYVFETKPNNKTLPEALKALKPEDRVGDKAVYEDNKPADPKAPDTSSEAAQKALVEMKGGNKVGEWKAGNWVKTTDAKGNITYTLTWTFEEVKKDKPRPSTPTRPSTPSTPSTPTTPSTPVRVNGKDRVDTAIEISKKYFGQAERVIIVDASNFPDAMAASALAKQLKAPILLTKSNNLDSRVAAEIKRLGAHNVTVIGGKSSVSDGALNQISKFDKDGVERISGKDRYETSAEVARRLAKITGKTGHAVIASGEVFADALAVGPYAAREGYPILLVKSNSIPKSISDLITEIGVKKVSIVGGYGSVSKSLEKSLPLVAERLSGKTRYETAIEIASKGLKTSNKVFVANGAEWMDALVIGPVGGLLNMPILLTGANSAPQSLRDHIAKSKIDKITAIGGRSKVSDRVLNELSK